MPPAPRWQLNAWFLPLLLVAANLGAKTLDENVWVAQRSEFVAAEQALQRGKTQEYRRLKAQLRDYPLYPYLEYEALRKHLSWTKRGEVDRFLVEYDDTPLAGRLRGAWLNLLAKQHRWSEFLDYYRPTTQTKRNCQRLQALIETGRRTEAFAEVPPIWLHGKSQPEACDPVFNAWRQAGRLTPDLTWGRIALAMDRNQIRLARYLKRYLPSAEQPWVERWLRAHRDPQSVLRDPALAQAHPKRGAILLHALRRQVRKDPAKAVEMWAQLERKHAFDPAQSRAAERSLALGLARAEHPQALRWLEASEPAADDERLQEKRILTALRSGDWQRAIGWIDALPPEQRGAERWRYWKARSLAELGRQPEAEALYRALAEERSYYGFLAADRIGAPYNLYHAEVPASAAELAEMRRQPGIQRAHELYRLGRMTDARREWHFLTRTLDRRDLQLAAKLADRWGWHDRAIFTLAKTDYWDDLELRFPLTHRRQIEAQAGDAAVESAWVFAVVRQESAFMPDARSHAGALGLMQLMPATAKDQARRMQPRPAWQRRHLVEPDNNIRLGAAYLSRVYQDLYRHPVLATAAYNAGPNRVKGWLPESELPADLWIEMIPFSETRTYVRRVMTYTVIYEHRLHSEPTRISERLRPIGTPANLAASEAAAKGSRG